MKRQAVAAFAVLLMMLGMGLPSAVADTGAGVDDLVATAKGSIPPAGDDGFDLGPTPRVIGGTAVPYSTSPWIVALMQKGRPSGPAAQFCGGSLIARQWVLTAAHCVDGVTANQLDIGVCNARLSALTASRRLAVSKIVMHQQYNRTNLRNDIALIRLAAPAPTCVKVIPLYTKSNGPALGTETLLTGWGSVKNPPVQYPDLLQGAVVRILAGPGQACGSWPSSLFLPAKNLCTGETNASQSACFGDSGGPYVVNDGGKLKLAGLVSYGRSDACAKVGYPAVATRVSAFVGWVNTNMKDDGGGGGGAKPSAPRQLKGVVSPGQVVLSWNAPLNSGGSPIGDYVLQARLKGAANWTTLADGVSAARSVRVTGLVKNVQYQFRVAAVNNGGRGPWSNTLTVTGK